MEAEAVRFVEEKSEALNERSSKRKRTWKLMIYEEMEAEAMKF